MPAAGTGRVTERTFYDALLAAIRDRGGTGVQEISFNGEPDIKFRLIGRDWLLGVKIGQSSSTLTSAFLQFSRHKHESGIESGILLFLPDSVRKIRPTEEAIAEAVSTAGVLALVDASTLQKQYGDRTFPHLLETIQTELAPLLAKGVATTYPLPTVISMLQVQVQELMDRLAMGEREVLRIITDRALLSDLGSLTAGQENQVTRFLGAYIVLSQILFLRFLSSARTELDPPRPVTRRSLRESFAKVLEINYRPIYELDVLDALPEEYVRATFDLIWALQLEKIRYELPGRIFHELMPGQIRKLLAAFYTRPQAAELLARLVVRQADDSVLDPACGSGTILVSTYRVKEERYGAEGRIGSPHKLFCEEQIFGADIMPFAVHLTSANLAAMDVQQTLDRTLVFHADSLSLVPGKAYGVGFLQGTFLAAPRTGVTTKGEAYEVPLDKVDVVAMNPPFTKVERRIRDYVHMQTFADRAGGEVGLWGHFVFLADEFLKAEGMMAAVLPINVLRGRESQRVRDFLFGEWTPLYVLKPTLNYGFSEWAEYRDTIVIARKAPPPSGHRVKFCLVKAPLQNLDEDTIADIADTIRSRRSLRSENLDIDSHPLPEVRRRSMNMMWFLGVTDLSHRDVIIDFVGKFKLGRFPEGYFREGYRPVPKGVSAFTFLTRDSNPARLQEAFLSFRKEGARSVSARSALGVRFKVERDALVPSLRTPTGVERMDVTDSHDFLAVRPYAELPDVRRAVGFKGRLGRTFWRDVEASAGSIQTHLMTVRRINPYSPNHHLAAFFSETLISPANTLNVVMEADADRAKAVCTVLNSSLFWAHFFLLKEESTGRYIDVRFYDLYEMPLFPEPEHVKPLNEAFAKYGSIDFPALRYQFDQDFDERYDEFWEHRDQPAIRRLWSVLERPLRPAPVRMKFDLDVADALGVSVDEEELLRLYEVFVKEMIITRHLTRD